MKITSEKLLITCGKMQAARWAKMKNSGLWLLSSCLLADALKAHAKSLHRQARNQAQLKKQPLLKAESNFYFR